MTRLLILSDYLSIRSDGHAKSLHLGPTKAPPQTAERFTAARAPAAGLVDRDLQTVRATELPLSRRSRTRPETIFGDQPARWPSAQRICAKRRLRAGYSLARQLSPAARSPERDLRDQRGTPATARGSRIDRHGPGTHRLRLCQSGSHRRRYDRVLSRCRSSTVRSGEAQ
jgi:hypothetical protein